MIYGIYSVKDSKVGFGSPFFDSSDDSAIRGFNYAFDSNTGIIRYSPGDFQLFKLGVFDSVSGHIEPCIPVFIADFVSKMRSDEHAE